MENAKSLETSVRVRKECPECKKFFYVQIKSDGDIVGKCPHCHAKYFEQSKNKVRLIKIVRE